MIDITPEALRARADNAPKETRTEGITRGVWLNAAHYLTITPDELRAIADALERGTP